MEQMSKKHYEPTLEIDLFAGDYGDVEDRTLSDKIVKCRKAHECSHCLSAIESGTFNRVITEIVRHMGGFHVYRVCQPCLDALLLDETEGCVNFHYAKRSDMHRTVSSGLEIST